MTALDKIIRDIKELTAMPAVDHRLLEINETEREANVLFNIDCR